MEAIPIILFVAIAVFALGFAWWWERRRNKAIEAWAQEHGFRVALSNDRGFDERYQVLDICRVGSSRKAKRQLFGALPCRYGELELTIADYQYTTGSGKNRSTHSVSLFIVELPWRVPVELRIKPEHWLHKVASVVGFDDIDFESGEFSRAFHVKAKERKFAYDVIDQGMMDYLLQRQDLKPYFEFDGALMAYVRERHLKPHDFTAVMELMTGVIDRIPDHVVASLAKNGEAS